MQKTLRAAQKKGFDAYLIADASATYSALLQRRVERRFGERAITSEQAISVLASGAPTVPTA